MKRFKVKSKYIDLSIEADTIQVNKNQIELWKCDAIIAVFSKNTSVFSIE